MPILFVVIGFFCLAATFFFWQRNRRSIPLPPGPTGLPLLGHLYVVPSDRPEVCYEAEGKRQQSDVLFFKILGQPMVVLNSVVAAVDLLDTRGANYADRPGFDLLRTLGFRETLTFLRSGPQFQAHRKTLQTYFTKSSVVAYRDIQTSEARGMVKNLLTAPDRFNHYIRRAATSIVMTVAFGHTITSDDDPYIQIANDTAYALGNSGAPAGTLMDFFPAIGRLPDWLQFDRHVRFAKEWNWALRNLFEIPFAQVRDQMREGTAEASFLHTLLERNDALKARGKQLDFTLDDIKGAAGAIYVAGQDTTHATMMVCLLNLTLHPEVVKRAQEEIDRVVGPDRLPEFSDRDDMPYTNYMIHETLRWMPVSPLGVPHKSSDEDVYRGMVIPKGSYVYANAWAMCHDEKVYKDPLTFNPDRYKPIAEGGNGEPLPSGQFGFGRRVCVGRHLAEASVWMMLVSIVSVMDVKKALDSDGKEIEPEIAFTPGLSSHPKKFGCRIVPRSAHAEKLLLSATM